MNSSFGHYDQLSIELQLLQRKIANAEATGIIEELHLIFSKLWWRSELILGRFPYHAT